jgi:hypothetical protein
LVGGWLSRKFLRNFRNHNQQPTNNQAVNSKKKLFVGQTFLNLFDKIEVEILTTRLPHIQQPGWSVVGCPENS